ncbi:unnamed protein product [Cylindrotheca closterium]|uniref:Uncharacterized protein n=1 Tax=Cylindrotheca closterium TaxID=2856 RepID=A0AAD2CNW8_9STRA|nr:unnamed protein product [Cylindrotheca closterium]
MFPLVQRHRCPIHQQSCIGEDFRKSFATGALHYSEYLSKRVSHLLILRNHKLRGKPFGNLLFCFWQNGSNAGAGTGQAEFKIDLKFPILHRALLVQWRIPDNQTLARSSRSGGGHLKTDWDGGISILLQKGTRKMIECFEIEAIDSIIDAFYPLASGAQQRRHTTAGWDFYVTWKGGSSNWIPLKDMKESFPIEVAVYAISKGIQDEPAFAWWIPHVVRKQKRFLGKVKSKYWERTHKYGIRIPKSIKEAIKIYKANGDTLWQDSIQMEMKNNQVAFEEFDGDVEKLMGYKKITGHLVFDVKLGENF